jgi:hypothetical protein
MTRETDLVSYLPPFMAEYKELKDTLKAEDREFSMVWNAADRVLSNEFIATADEYGISRFESFLGITPDAEDTLESRRARVQSRWFTSLPYSWKMLITKMTSLCGSGNFRLDLEDYCLYVDTELSLYGEIGELETMLEAMLPCNIVVYGTNTLEHTLESSVFGSTVTVVTRKRAIG